MHKFGRNGEVVEAFLDEVSVTDHNRWTAFVQAIAAGRAGRAAQRALDDVAMPAAVETAVFAAAQAAVARLSLDTSTVLDANDAVRISGRVQSAALAVAVAEKLPPESLAALLAPFADSGFSSLRGPYDAAAGQITG